MNGTALITSDRSYAGKLSADSLTWSEALDGKPACVFRIIDISSEGWTAEEFKRHLSTELSLALFRVFAMESINKDFTPGITAPPMMTVDVVITVDIPESVP